MLTDVGLTKEQYNKLKGYLGRILPNYTEVLEVKKSVILTKLLLLKIQTVVILTMEDRNQWHFSDPLLLTDASFIQESSSINSICKNCARHSLVILLFWK